MDGPRDYHTKWSKPAREKINDIAYMLNLKKKKNIWKNLFTKQK